MKSERRPEAKQIFELEQSAVGAIEASLDYKCDFPTVDQAFSALTESIRRLPETFERFRQGASDRCRQFEIEIALAEQPHAPMVARRAHGHQYGFVVGYVDGPTAAKLVQQIGFFLDLFLDQLWLEEIHDATNIRVRSLRSSIGSSGLHGVVNGGFLYVVFRLHESQHEK